jgi:hypothetical protein
MTTTFRSTLPYLLIFTVLFFLTFSYQALGFGLHFYTGYGYTGAFLGDCYHFNLGLDIAPTLHPYTDAC